MTTILPTFDQFWDLYDKKVGREMCEVKWAKISQADREKLIQHVPAYVLSTPEKRYRKNPHSYLNQKSWNDEIITTNNGANRVFDRNEVEAGIRQHFDNK